jgi:hypothetical protein
MMSGKRHFSTAEAREIGTRLGVDWMQVDLDQLRRGLEVELEHGAHDAQTNVTSDDLDLTGKIAWAHLKEIRDYYTRLDAMEADAKREKASVRSYSATDARISNRARGLTPLGALAMPRDMLLLGCYGRNRSD